MIVVLMLVLSCVLLLMGCDNDSKFTLTIQVVEGEGEVVPPSGTQYEEGSIAILKVFPEEKWILKWQGVHGHEVVHDKKNIYQLFMDSNKGVKAVFERAKYTLSVRAEGESSVSPSLGSHDYEEGTVVDLIATPSSGWEFKEWVGEVANAGSANTTVLMNGDKEVTAAVFVAVFVEKTS